MAVASIFMCKDWLRISSFLMLSVCNFPPSLSGEMPTLGPYLVFEIVCRPYLQK